LGLLIATCIFVYEWAKYGDKSWLKGSKTLKNKRNSAKK
jgi:hypothetical protein